MGLNAGNELFGVLEKVADKVLGTEVDEKTTKFTRTDLNEESLDGGVVIDSPEKQDFNNLDFSPQPSAYTIELDNEDKQIQSSFEDLETQLGNIGAFVSSVQENQGINQTLALEAYELVPGFKENNPIGYFTKHVSKTNLTASLESIVDGIKNAIKKIFETIYKAVAWVFKKIHSAFGKKEISTAEELNRYADEVGELINDVPAVLLIDPLAELGNNSTYLNAIKKARPDILTPRIRNNNELTAFVILDSHYTENVLRIVDQIPESLDKVIDAFKHFQEKTKDGSKEQITALTADFEADIGFKIDGVIHTPASAAKVLISESVKIWEKHQSKTLDLKDISNKMATVGNKQIARLLISSLEVKKLSIQNNNLDKTIREQEAAFLASSTGVNSDQQKDFREKSRYIMIVSKRMADLSNLFFTTSILVTQYLKSCRSLLQLKLDVIAALELAVKEDKNTNTEQDLISLKSIKEEVNAMYSRLAKTI